MGINTVVLIRAGLAKWIASPFQCLLGKEDVYYPPVDLVEMFLTLADKYNMAFYFGMYDSGKYMVIINHSRAGICHKKSAGAQRICPRFMQKSGNMPKQFPGICRPWSLLIYTE